VTVGGGEPLAQWAFVRELADRLRKRGVHVALDTACVAPHEVIADVPAHVDLILADLKLVDPERHRRWTGAGNAGILRALRLWSAAMPGRLWISVPLIPGVHDEAEVGRMAAFVASLAGPPPVRLLPYHRLGEGKYRALGWPVPAFEGATEPLLEEARRAFQGWGIAVRTDDAGHDIHHDRCTAFAEGSGRSLSQPISGR
jgi:pyruvate formate lyase activating enzyme